ncbi:unnamed protein product [Peniophora sp. CBMAI 1063]|nr:unnamed protein product [Peniophora sp. CBMAI 1063]
MPHNSASDKPGDVLWSAYLKASEKGDRTRPKDWEGSAGGILTFTGLFSATVAAFIIESYKSLSPDSGDQTVALLSQVLPAMVNASSQQAVIMINPRPFQVAPLAVATNVLWITSLLISLFCALLSTLVQQWARSYVREVNEHHATYGQDLRRRACYHLLRRMGVDSYGLDEFVSWIVALVHLSIFLFTIGLALFLFPINTAVAAVVLGLLGLFALIYTASTILPLMDESCPYETPMTRIAAFGYQVILRIHGTSWTEVFHKTLHRFHGHWINSRFISRERRRHDFTSRRDVQDLDIGKFLSERRKICLWDYTGHHVPDDDFEPMMGDLVSLISGARSEGMRNHLCADDALARRLYSHIYDSGTTANPDLFAFISTLSSAMLKQEVDGLIKRIRPKTHLSGYYIGIIGTISRISKVDGPVQVLAHLCLAEVRRSFLLLCLSIDESEIPLLSMEQLSRLYEDTTLGDFELKDRHPIGLLHMMVVGEYYDFRWNFWDNMSILQPLHDDDCCRTCKHPPSRESLAHIAACNALTVVSHVLTMLAAGRATGESIGPHLRSELNTTFAKMTSLMKQFPMAVGERKASAPEFLSVLQAAGVLDEWMQPGSDLRTDSKHGVLHDYYSWAPWYDECIDLLRALAQNVDFTKHRSRRSSFQSTPIATSAMPSSTNPSPYTSTTPYSHAVSEHPWLTPPSRQPRTLDDQPPSLPIFLEGVVVDGDRSASTSGWDPTCTG